MNSYGVRDGRVDVELGLSWTKESGVVQHRYPRIARLSEEVGASLVGAVQTYSYMLSPASVYSPVEVQLDMPSARTRRVIGSAFISMNVALTTIAITPSVAQGAQQIFLR